VSKQSINDVMQFFVFESNNMSWMMPLLLPKQARLKLQVGKNAA
jgi:hypothetical protein